MSDLSRFLSAINHFFGCLRQAGLTPELMRELSRDVEQFGNSEAPSAVEVATALMGLVAKLEAEWVARPGTALMELCRALLSVQQAYSTQPAQLPWVLAAIHRHTDDLAI